MFRYLFLHLLILPLHALGVLSIADVSWWVGL